MRYEVIIVGGGIIGCLTAYYLHRKGLKRILILDRGRLGSAATTQSASMLLNQTGDPTLSELAQYSLRRYFGKSDNGIMQPLHEKCDIGARRTGSILYTTDSKFDFKLDQMKDIHDDLGIPSELIDVEEIQQHCSALNTEGLSAGIHCPDDGYLTSQNLIQALEFYFRDNGIDVRQHHNVRRIEGSISRGFEVSTNLESFHCAKVVNAAGGLAGKLAKFAGDRVDIRLSKRHVVVFKKGLRVDQESTPFPILENVNDEWYCRPHGNDILVGVGAKEDIKPTDLFDYSKVERQPEFLEMAYNYIGRRFPGWDIKEAGFWAGARPMSKNLLPVICESPGTPGIYHACGMSEFGITTAPACAEILSSIILGTGSEQFSQETIDKLGLDYERLDPKVSENSDDGNLAIFPSSRIQTIIESTSRNHSFPFYLYDLGRLRLDSKSLVKSLAEFELLYAVKANPNDELFSVIADEGYGADVSSKSEFRKAQKQDIPLDKILFGGPGKTSDEICDFIIQAGCLVSFESVGELEAFSRRAKRSGKAVRGLLRVNSIHRPESAGEFMAGGPSQFGIDQEEIDNIKPLLLQDNIELIGIHVHVASQILDEDAIIDHLEKTSLLAKDLSKSLGFKLEVINYGGGIGVPYSTTDLEPNPAIISAKAIQKIKDIFGSEFGNIRYQLELGRAVVANCGRYITNILDAKTSRGTNFLVAKSGISGFSRPAMHWAQQHRCWTLPIRNGDRDYFTVTGETCLPADILAERAELSSPKKGDIICFEQAGAYGYSMSLLEWSGLGKPGEITFE